MSRKVRVLENVEKRGIFSFDERRRKAATGPEEIIIFRIIRDGIFQIILSE